MCWSLRRGELRHVSWYRVRCPCSAAAWARLISYCRTRSYTACGFTLAERPEPR